MNVYLQNYMLQVPNILDLAQKRPVMLEALDILHEKERQTPGAVQYSIKRYSRIPQWNAEDMGMMVYHYKKNEPAACYLELRFCVSGNVYCRGKEQECLNCRNGLTKVCSEKEDTIDVMNFTFLPEHLLQFVKSPRSFSFTNDVLCFKHPSSFTKILPLCSRVRVILESLLSNTYTESFENIYINAQTQMLLLYSLECMLGDKEEETFSCKFLANESDRDKILKAREVLLEHIGEPITIKDLSRKVAINECYLKKGFKEIFGTTIFDFYQSQRMEHAKYLLYEKGLSVTEVSLMLGYSSISHFSTAFKKHTGLKPCELLLR
ncbi:AraC family transcriptional regulator [Agriterribacter sp.]|uniref:helix-turn-helix domain-containing protein n=1 Tax=Agriterribacter sp. TaxID=2821509 RepID=UPI002D1F9E50|nr:AraC family transcriptional regulator [Agriterribacter sp.]